MTTPPDDRSFRREMATAYRSGWHFIDLVTGDHGVCGLGGTHSMNVALRTGEAGDCAERHNGGEGGDKHRAKHSVTHSRLRPHLKVPFSPVE